MIASVRPSRTGFFSASESGTESAVGFLQADVIERCPMEPRNLVV